MFGLAWVSVWAFAVVTTGQDKEKAVEAVRPAGAEIGKPAPEFALKDLDGKEHKLSDLAGKIVVLEWTNPKCPYVVYHQTKAKTTPHMFVIDKAGVLVYDGAIDDNPDPLTAKESQPEPKNYVAMAIDALLAGKEIKPSKTQPYGCGVKYAE